MLSSIFFTSDPPPLFLNHEPQSLLDFLASPLQKKRSLITQKKNEKKLIQCLIKKDWKAYGNS